MNTPRPLPTTFDRRRDRALRALVGLTEAAIERGDLTPEGAAEVLLRCGLPTDVACDVIARAQGMDVVGDWPKLCEAVTLPRYEPSDWTSTL